MLLLGRELMANAGLATLLVARFARVQVVRAAPLEAVERLSELADLAGAFPDVLFS